ncbi:MAG: hypothetical protein K2J39_11735 [Ruminococcus sp.]|nr:hypothetical protein [Ruminococcus sp.]
MKILNIHGYKGIAENSACMTLKKLGHEVISPQIDYDAKTPSQIHRDLQNIFNENKPDYIVGTSLGGFFAMLIARRNTDIPVVLVSPCFIPPVTLPELGYKVDRIRKMTFVRYADMIEKMNRHNITAIIGGQDEVIDYHSFTTESLIKNCYVVPDGMHSGATLNLDYWFKELIK